MPERVIHEGRDPRRVPRGQTRPVRLHVSQQGVCVFTAQAFMARVSVVDVRSVCPEQSQSRAAGRRVIRRVIVG